MDVDISIACRTKNILASKVLCVVLWVKAWAVKSLKFDNLDFAAM